MADIKLREPLGRGVGPTYRVKTKDRVYTGTTLYKAVAKALDAEGPSAKLKAVEVWPAKIGEDEERVFQVGPQTVETWRQFYAGNR